MLQVRFQDGKERYRGDNRNTSMFAKAEEMFVPTDDVISFTCQGCLNEDVILRIGNDNSQGRIGFNMDSQNPKRLD